MKRRFVVAALCVAALAFAVAVALSIKVYSIMRSPDPAKAARSVPAVVRSSVSIVIQRMLADGKIETRRKAIRVLVGLRDVKGVRNALTDSDWQVVHTAADGLRDLKTTKRLGGQDLLALRNAAGLREAIARRCAKEYKWRQSAEEWGRASFLVPENKAYSASIPICQRRGREPVTLERVYVCLCQVEEFKSAWLVRFTVNNNRPYAIRGIRLDDKDFMNLDGMGSNATTALAAKLVIERWATDPQCLAAARGIREDIARQLFLPGAFYLEGLAPNWTAADASYSNPFLTLRKLRLGPGQSHKICSKGVLPVTFGKDRYDTSAAGVCLQMALEKLKPRYDKE